MNRWGYARVMPAGRWPSLQRAFWRLLLQQFPNLLHSSLPSLPSQPISTANLPQGEVPSNPSLLQMGGRKDRIAAEKDPQVNKSLPTQQGWRICIWLAVWFFFFARICESNSLYWERKGQKTSCLPNHGLASLQNVTFTPARWSFCLIHHWKPRNLILTSAKHIHSLCLSGYKE